MQTGKEQDERESWSNQESKSQETSEWMKKKREEKGERQTKTGRIHHKRKQEIQKERKMRKLMEKVKMIETWGRQTEKQKRKKRN